MRYIETQRLILRDWEKTDLELFRQLNSDEKVMEYLPKTLSYEETDLFYETIRKEFRDYNFGLYAVEVKDNKEFIGFIGFHRATFDSDFTPCIEIGWRLRKDAWGKGYATEGGKACLQFGFEELGFEEVYSFTAQINGPSQNVMEKLGMSYVKDFNHPKVDSHSSLYKHVLYKIDKSQILE